MKYKVQRNNTRIEPLTPENINKYKSSDNLLRHLRFNKDVDGLFLVDLRGKLIGYAAWQNSWLIAFEVSKDYRGKGYGKNILGRIPSDVIWLTVNPKNIPAKNLYKSQGWKYTGEKAGILEIWRKYDKI